MHIFTNLVLYLVLALGAGLLLRSLNNPNGSPRLQWHIAGLIIGVLCAVVNAVLVSAGLLFGFAFNLDLVLGPFLGGFLSGLLIGLPIGLITAYDMFKRFTFID